MAEDEASNRDEPMDTRWVWVGERGEMRYERAAITVDDEWPETVKDLHLTAIVFLPREGKRDLGEYICARGQSTTKVSHGVDPSGALAISWDDKIRLVYAAGQWRSLMLPNP